MVHTHVKSFTIVKNRKYIVSRTIFDHLSSSKGRISKSSVAAIRGQKIWKHAFSDLRFNNVSNV